MKDSREIIKTQVVEHTEIEHPFEQQINQANGRYPGYRDMYAQDGSQLLDYWRAIRKRLWLVIGIAVLMTTLAAIYMARKPNVYQAKAVVQVDLEQPNQELVTSERRKSIGNPDPSYFNTQLQLLNSDGLLRRVVQDLNLENNQEFKNEIAKGNVSTTRSILKAVGMASDDSKKEDKGVEEVTNTTDSSVASPEEIAEAIRLSPFVDMIQKNVTVEPVRESRLAVKETRLIEIYFRNTDAQLATTVVNGIAATFTKTNQEKRFGTSKKTNEYLADRVATLQAEIKQGEEKLFQLKQNADILKPDEEPSVAMVRLSGLNKTLLEAENERKNAQAQYEAVRNSPEKMRSLAEQELLKYTTDIEAQLRADVSEINKQLNGLEAQRKKILVEYQPNSLEVREYDVQIKKLEDAVLKRQQKSERDLKNFREQTTKVILSNLETKYLQAKGNEDKIRASYNSQYSIAEGQDLAGVRIRILEQELETKKEFLKNIQSNVSENDVIASGMENNISIAEIAIPPDKPISPRRLTTVVAVLFLSTLFGMGLALFLEYLDDTIRTTEEVENYLQLPALAAIPTIDSMPKRRLLLVGANENGEHAPETDLLIHTDSRSSLAESFRQLRTSILLSTAGHPPKSFLITSSLPAEGKTTTAINTAISLAQTGAKVLIIDADMRRPRLHSVFNISNGEGLSSLLASDLNTDETLAVVQYDEASKLHLLPSGPIPPNPAELIGSEQMASLLKLLQENFTHVVVDSPPIASFTDGVLVASMVDGVILVVNSGKSSRQVVRRSRQLLMDIGAKIFGVVLNNVNLKSQDNNYYYQSYYHRDNYRKDDID